MPAADGAASTNGNGVKEESPGQTPPQRGTNGSTDGTNQQPHAEASSALPIQSVDPSPGGNQVPVANAAAAQAAAPTDPPQDSKEWDKLPKQDAAAASLLSDSPLPRDLDWIDPSLVTAYSEMGLGRTSNPETAQVHPYHFTTSLAQLARERGVNFLLGAKVTRINHSRTSVSGVEYEDRATGGERIIGDATDVVVTAGPWTGRLLPKTKVEGLRAHSVVYAADVSPYAVFTDVALPGDWAPEHRRAKGQRRKHRGNVDPEVYARPGGEVYACGTFFWSCSFDFEGRPQMWLLDMLRNFPHLFIPMRRAQGRASQ